MFKYLKEFAKYIWPVLLYFSLTFIGSFISLFIIMFISFRDYFFNGLPGNFDLMNLIVGQPYYIISLGIASLLGLFLIYFKYQKYMPYNPELNSKNYISFFFYGMAINLFLSFGLSPFLSEEIIEESNASAAQLFVGHPAFVILVCAILVPIFEEFIFRYLFMRSKFPHLIKAKIKKVDLETISNDGVCFFINALIQGVVFGLMHGSPFQTLYTSVMGIIFAYVNKKYGSILPSILIHIGLNFFASLMTTIPNTTLLVLIMGGIGVILLCVNIIKNLRRDSK